MFGSWRKKKTTKPVDAISSMQPMQLTYEPVDIIGQGSCGSIIKVDLQYTKGTYNKKDNGGNIVTANVPEWAYNKINKNQWVLKTVDSSKAAFSNKEASSLARYQPTFAPFQLDQNYIAWISRLVPGETILNKINSKSLNFDNALTLINRIALALNLHHHNTPSTGPAVVHGDIQPLNVMANDDEVNFIDYGFTIDLDNDDPNIQISRYIEGLNERYFAPEAIDGQWGIKTDIYMMGSIFQLILERMQFPNTRPNIKIFIDQFVARMRDHEYENRPDSDETLKFFHTVNLFYKVNNQDESNDDLKYEYAAKLALLTHNQWNDQITTKAAFDKDADQTLRWQNFDFSKPNYSFANRPIISRLIVELAAISSEEKKLSEIKFNDLVLDDGIRQRALKILNDNKLVNEKVLNALIANPALCKNIISEERRPLALRSTILSSLVNEMSKPQLEIVLNQISMFSTPDLSFLTTLKGSVKDCREKALFIIKYLVNNARLSADIDVIKSQLIDLAKTNKLGFLHDRQGFFTFSINNHKWNNEKVSATWVDVMKSIDKKQAELDIAHMRSSVR